MPTARSIRSRSGAVRTARVPVGPASADPGPHLSPGAAIGLVVAEQARLLQRNVVFLGPRSDHYDQVRVHAASVAGGPGLGEAGQ